MYPNRNWVYKLRISDVQDMNENAIFGNEWNSIGPFAMFYNSIVRYHIGGTVIDSNDVSNSNILELEFGNAYVKVNGQTFSKPISSGNIANNSDLYLFGCSHTVINNGDWLGEQYRLKCKLYYFKIEYQNLLIRDMVPSINQNIPCMYDKISHQFFSNNQGIGKSINKNRELYARLCYLYLSMKNEKCYIIIRIKVKLFSYLMMFLDQNIR